jgi:hypothetical protein
MKDIAAITNHEVHSTTDLKHRIMKLNAMKAEQELELKRDLKEMYYSLQLSTMIKKTVRDLSTDPEVKTNAIETTINIGSNFLLDKLLLRRGSGIKSYLINAGLKKLVSYFTSGHRITDLIQKRTH